MNKQELIREISLLIGREAPPISTGSTEPREIFDLVNTELGLGLESLTRKLTKPEMARAIVECTGEAWHAECESRGGTVTKTGLAKVLEAVVFLTSS